MFLPNFRIKLLNSFTKAQPIKNFPAKIESILILIPSELELAIQSLPLLYSIKNKFPNSTISLVVSKYNIGLFESLEVVDNFFLLNNNYKNLFNQLESHNFDIFYNPSDMVSLPAISLTSRVTAKYKIGISSQYHDKYFNIILDNCINDNLADKYASLMRNYNVNFPLEFSFELPAENEVYMAARLGYNPDLQYIAINLSSSSHDTGFSYEKWQDIISHLFKNNLCDRIFLFTNKSDELIATMLNGKFGKKIIYPTGIRNILDSAVLISISRLFISPASMIIHIASYCKTPIIALLGNNPKIKNRFIPYNIDFQINESSTSETSEITSKSIIENIDILLK